MRCEKAKELMLDATGPESMNSDLEEHIASCPACREHCQMIGRQRELLERVASPQAPDELWGRIEKEISAKRTIPLRPMMWSAAAAAVVLIMVGLAFFMQPTTDKTGEGTAKVAVKQMEIQPVEYLVEQHAALQNANILNAALVSETEQRGYVMLAGGTH